MRLSILGLGLLRTEFDVSDHLFVFFELISQFLLLILDPFVKVRNEVVEVVLSLELGLCQLKM